MATKLTILHVSNGSVPIPPRYGGGTEAYIWGSAQEFVKLGHSVVILDRRRSPAEPLRQLIDGAELVRLSVPCLLPRRGLSLSPSLALTELNHLLFGAAARATVYNYDPDIIFLHSSFTALPFFVMPTLSKRIVFVTHSARRYSVRKSLANRLAVKLEDWSIKRATLAMVYPEATKEALVKAGVSGHKLAVIPDNCPDPLFFANGHSEADETEESVRTRYQSEGKFVALCVSRIRRGKGIEVLVQGIDVLVNVFGYGDVKLLVAGPVEDFGFVGNTSYSTFLETMVEQRGLGPVVHFLGAVPIEELRKLYRATDAYVHASFEETGSMAVAEAMASGKPVIAPSIGGLKAYLQDGVNSIVVPPGGAEAIARGLKLLIDEPQKRLALGMMAEATALSQFHWPIVARKMLDSCLQLAHKMS